MKIGEVCKRTPVTCTRAATVSEVARLMRASHVGDVIVVDPLEDGQQPVGIVTDRDLVVAVLARDLDPGKLCAGDVMRTELATVAESDGVYDAIWQMRSKGIRRLPIVNARNSLTGVLAADDVTRFLADELSEVARIAPHQIQHEKSALDPLVR